MSSPCRVQTNIVNSAETDVMVLVEDSSSASDDSGSSFSSLSTLNGTAMKTVDHSSENFETYNNGIAQEAVQHLLEQTGNVYLFVKTNSS